MRNALPELYRILQVATITLFLTGCVVHAPPPVVAGDIAVSGRVEAGDAYSRVVVEFSSDDRRYIDSYYHRERERYRKYEKRKKLPPGLAKREQLPPGLQRQIQRNGKLPPGLEGEHLPVELERRLSPLPASYIRLQIGRDIVLMDQRTRVTIDVIKNIVP